MLNSEITKPTHERSNESTICLDCELLADYKTCGLFQREMKTGSGSGAPASKSHLFRQHTQNNIYMSLFDHLFLGFSFKNNHTSTQHFASD